MQNLQLKSRNDNFNLKLGLPDEDNKINLD